MINFVVIFFSTYQIDYQGDIVIYFTMFMPYTYIPTSYLIDYLIINNYLKAI
jgi:hypothetical protein